jgi:nucleotide-binding universal stress UspA family protein
MSRTSDNADQVEQRTGTTLGPVVVGFDNSEQAGEALTYAAAQAAHRGVGLRIVTAFGIVVSDLGLGMSAPWDAELVESVKNTAEREADAGAERVRSEHPGLAVDTVVAPGPAAAVILEQAGDASLVVVGSRGGGGFMGLLLGGTSREVATHCHAPVVVVRNGVPTGDKVVVGIDGSPDSVGALAFAFDMASREGLRLLAVHTWDVPPIGAITGVPSPEPPELVKEIANNEARAALEELSGFSERYPDVEVEHTIVRGSPVKTLVASSEDAAMVIVGSRGRGGFLGLVLGSVSHGVLHHATCNVGVVTA